MSPIINKCCICLDDIIDDKAPTFTNCTHNENVHLKCIMDWNKPSCPLCRRYNRSFFQETEIIYQFDYHINFSDSEPQLRTIDDYVSIQLLQETFMANIEDAYNN